MNIGFYGIKVISIFIVSIVYVIFGTGLSISLNMMLPYEDPKHYSTLRLCAEIASIFGIIAIAYYMMRHFIKNMPFILDGVYGFRYSMLKETSGGVIVAFILFSYQHKLRSMLTELQGRITSLLTK